MRAIADFCNTWSREARRFFTDWRLMAILLVIPLLYITLFGEMYSQQRVKEVPTVIQDNDRSPLSRQIVQALDATDTYMVIGSVADLHQFREMNWSGKAAVCVVIPEGLQRDVIAGKPARVLVAVDGSNMIIANATTRGIAEVIQTFSAGISLRKWTARGVPPEHTRAQVLPIEVGLRLWYNPTFNYTNFLLIGLVGTVIQQVVLLAVALSWAKEYEENTLAELKRAAAHPAAAALAKLSFYVMVSFAMCLILFMLPFGKFGVPLRGDVSLLLTATFLFIVGLVGFGVFISSLSRSQLLSTQILMLIALPSFLLSGFTWPQFAMPEGIQLISQALPLTHYLALVRNTVSNGAGWAFNIGELRWLYFFAVTGVLLQFVSVWRLFTMRSTTETHSEEEYAGNASIQQATNRA